MPRTIQDRLISGLNEIRFAVTEPLQLRLARARYEGLYAAPPLEPFVSVYVPTYNRAGLLMERAIPSVLAQTYQNFELVVVGDHCTDDTGALVEGIQDRRVRFVNLPSRRYRYPPTAENHWLAGPVVAANAGLALARGLWIARIDDDDSWTPDHLEVLMKRAQEGQYEFVSGQFIEERFGKRKIVDGIRARDPYYTRGKIDPHDTSPKIGGTQTWLYRSYLRFMRYNINCWRKAWNRVNDLELSIRLYNAGVRMGFLDRVVAYVLPRPGEDTIGFEAYALTADAKAAHFKFDGHAAQ